MDIRSLLILSLGPSLEYLQLNPQNDSTQNLVFN
jgi:hypothetical protein